MTGHLLFQLVFTWPAYLLIICLAGAVVFALALYFRADRNKEVPKRVTRFLLFSRLVFIFLIAFFLLEPMLKHTTVQKEKPQLIVAFDNSQSVVMSKDSVWVKNELVKQVNAISDDLAEKFEIRPYFFDHALHYGDTVDFKGRETDFSGLFEEIANNYSNRNLGAVVIASDGLFNKGTNPLYTNKNLKYPVYTIALGDTTERKDLLVKKIVHNQVAYLGNKFPADIYIEGKKVKGTKATLSVSSDGKVLQQKQLDVNSDSWLQSFSFVFDADKPGVQKFNVFVTYADGESNKVNNASSFVVEVIDNREKILILAAAPHPDVAALKQTIEVNQNYEAEFALASEFNGPLKQYSLVILHLVPWNNTTGRIKNEIESNNIPYLLISGSAGDNLPGLKIGGPGNRFNDAEAVSNRTFSLFNISDELRTYAKNFPALKSPLGNYSSTNDIHAVFYQRIGIVETQNPLIYFTFNSQQKSGVILGDGIWRWRMRDYADHKNFNLFNELINKSIQYLSVKEDKSFFRVFTKKLFSENEEVEMDAEVYNNSYELITDPEVTVTIKNPEGKAFDYTFSRTNRGYKLGGIFFPPGEYSYEARVKINGALYSKKGLFTIKELVAERVNTVADHQLLYNLSKQTGGKLFYANQLEELKKELLAKEDIKTVSFEEKQLSDLIDLKWIFFILLAFVTVEWFVRKRNGLY